MHKRSFFIFILISLFSLNIYGQKKKFSSDDQKFPQELLQFMKNQHYKKRSNQFANDFNIFWNSGLDTASKEQIYNTCNLLLSKKARAYPNFYNYFNLIFVFSKNDSQNFKVWQKGFSAMIKSKQLRINKMDDFILQTQNLITDSIINKAPLAKWKITNPEYSYQLNGNQLSIDFAPTKVQAINKFDTITIHNTMGTYYPKQKIWVGTKGKVYWKPTATNKIQYVTFNQYSIDILKSVFLIDSVNFYNPQLSEKPIKGKFINKTNFTKNRKKVKYPQFESFSNDIVFKNLFKNINYKGGLSIHGNNLLGKGTQKNPAEIQILRNDTLLLVAKAPIFAFSNQQIISKFADINLKLDTCNLHHPRLFFRYNVNTKQLYLIRNKNNGAQSPFFNTFHNIIFDVEKLVWNINNNKIYLGDNKIGNKRSPHVESINFFDMNRFMQLQGIDSKNPLVLLYKYAEYVYSNTFDVAEYAAFIKKPIAHVKQQLITLSFQGFLSYNNDTEEITISNRVADYIRSAMGKQDYDVIRFKTEPNIKKFDGILDFKTNNLKINGVRQISVSDSQSVAIYPRDKQVVVHKNRNFAFGGKVEAGLIDLFGSDFKFSYDKFKIKFNHVDSLLLYTALKSKNKMGQRVLKRVGSALEQISGDLLIDDVNNKSGIKDFPEYTIFNSSDSCFVFYDKKFIYNGAYKRDSFFFKVEPFTIKDMNNLKDTDIQLKGELFSAGIFPNIKNELSLQKNNSLGFKYITPLEGLPTYKKGVFTDTITLSNKGLCGSGILSYLSTNIKSRNFVFLPKTMFANNAKFTGIAKYYPSIKGDSLNIKWQPKTDETTIKTTQKPLKIYNNKSEFRGYLNITPSNAFGDGKLSLFASQLTSKHFNFRVDSIAIDTADLKIFNVDSTKTVFKSASISGTIDMRNNMAHFTSNSKNHIDNFLAAKFIGKTNQFKWDIKNHTINFHNADKKHLSELWRRKQIHLLPDSLQNVFTASDPKKDSLSIKTPLAIYNLNSGVITTKYVQKVNIADAFIYPNNGDVNIGLQGIIDTLYKAQIIMDTLKKHHKIYDAKLTLKGKNEVYGVGKYNYVDNHNNEQIITINSIAIDSAKQTIAIGKIDTIQNFALSPNFNFYGNIKIAAKDSLAKLSGYALMQKSCSNRNNYWIGFTERINPNKIQIPTNSLTRDNDHTRLFNAFYLTNDSIHVYSSFLDHRNFYTDNVLLGADGYLQYNQQKRAYEIASKEKLEKNNSQGNILRMYPESCLIEGQGKINLGCKLGQIKQFAAGSITHKTSENDISINLSYGVNFGFNEEALKVMQEIFSNPKIPAAKIESSKFNQNLIELLGEPTAQQLITQQKNTGVIKILPPKLQSTFFFNQLKMIWHKKKKSYISEGKININNIKKLPINKEVTGKIVLNKKRSGNRLTIYLELDAQTWIFFDYFHGVMFVRSSNDKFNTIIHETKERKRQFKGDDKTIPYSYILATESRKDKFLKHLNREE